MPQLSKSFTAASVRTHHWREAIRSSGARTHALRMLRGFDRCPQIYTSTLSPQQQIPVLVSLPPPRGEYMSKKIWNCLPWNLGYFETVCPGQPENLQNCLSKHKVNIFQAMLKNIIYSHCAFNIKETQVCVWVDILPHHHNFQVLPHVTSLVQGEPIRGYCFDTPYSVLHLNIPYFLILNLEKFC